MSFKFKNWYILLMCFVFDYQFTDLPLSLNIGYFSVTAMFIFCQILTAVKTGIEKRFCGDEWEMGMGESSVPI